MVNGYLEQVYVKLFECYQQLENKNKLVTSDIIKAHFLGNTETRHSLSDIIEYHNTHMKDTLRWGTQKNYYTTHKYIYLFLKEKYKAIDMFLSELGYKFIIDFERFLRQQKKMGKSTVMKHIERLRKMVSLAFKIDWLDKDPFAKFEAKFEKKERGFFTSDELERIENKAFGIPRLQLIKDLFVFSCYTGLSYGEVMNDLCIGIDRKQWIHSQREKTNVPIKIPLLSKALEIINKYKTHPNTENKETLFPNISNQKLNFYLKEIADVCRVHKNLTFHIARHTFAITVMLSNGVAIGTVSKLLGHTKLSPTQIYARVVEMKISEDIQNLQMRFETKKNNPKQYIKTINLKA